MQLDIPCIWEGVRKNLADNPPSFSHVEPPVTSSTLPPKQIFSFHSMTELKKKKIAPGRSIVGYSYYPKETLSPSGSKFPHHHPSPSVGLLILWIKTGSMYINSIIRYLKQFNCPKRAALVIPQSSKEGLIQTVREILSWRKTACTSTICTTGLIHSVVFFHDSVTNCINNMAASFFAAGQCRVGLV